MLLFKYHKRLARFPSWNHSFPGTTLCQTQLFIREFIKDKLIRELENFSKGTVTNYVILLLHKSFKEIETTHYLFQKLSRKISFKEIKCCM